MSDCQRCQTSLDGEETYEHAGMQLCEDCYMDVMNPAKTCDPWATYTASRIPDQVLNPNQEKIMALIQDQGEVTVEQLFQATGLDAEGLKREVASLRHMEKIRAVRQEDGSPTFRNFA